MLDGVYHTGTEGALVFHPAPAQTGEKLQALLGKIITRILRLLTCEKASAAAGQHAERMAQLEVEIDTERRARAEAEAKASAERESREKAKQALLEVKKVIGSWKEE